VLHTRCEHNKSEGVLRMSIRAATSSDWNAIRQLLAAASLPTDDLTAASTSMFSLHATNEALRGAIALEPRDARNGMIRSLAVSAEARSQGIGQALVAHVEAAARDTGFETLYLLTDSAERFFARRGYARIDRAVAPECIRTHEQFRSLCPASAALMRKVLA
jgi:amino-acid N-acetyltransferase